MNALELLLPGLLAGPDDPTAVRVGPDAVSREALLAAAAVCADRIAGASTVAIEARPELATVIGVLGGLAAGARVVPIASDAGPLERDHVLADSAAEVILGRPDWAGSLRCVDLPTVGGSTAATLPTGGAARLVMYTSGTTGPPKGVVLSPEALAADLDALAAAWDWTAEDTLVHGLPLFHVHGLVLGVLGALRQGSRFVHTVRPTPAAYAAAGAAACTSACPPSGPGWSPSLRQRPRCGAPGCWSPAARACRPPCPMSCCATAASDRSSVTA